jgi:hypothetical protein
MPDGLMRTEGIYEIEKLVDCDTGNFAESKRALLEFHPDSLSATDECFKLLERIGILFGEACDYDKYNQQLNTWLKTQSGNREEKVIFLEKATLVGGIPEHDPIAEAKNAVGKANSVIARSYLLLRLGRDFFFGLSDLLRFRLTSMLGYMRVQTETIALIALLGTDLAMAVEWLNMTSPDEGKGFYRKHHGKIAGKLKELGLYDHYETGSNMSLHSRVFGVAQGIIIGKKAAPRGHIRLTYQELDDALDILFWFCKYLGAHKDMIDRLPQALPEVDFKQIDVRRYAEMVESLWARWRSVYQYRKRQKPQ